MNNQIKKYFINALLIILVPFIFIVSFAKTTETMPANAPVLVSVKTKLYYSPKFFSDYRISPADSLTLSTVRDARLKKYKANKRCRDEGYFTNEQGSIIWSWFDSAGIWKQDRRWNTDGSWNW